MKDHYFPKMLIVVRKDLEMPVGKLAVQVAHAACRLSLFGIKIKYIKIFPETVIPYRAQIFNDWLDPEKGNQAKIVLACKNEGEIYKLHEKAMGVNIPATFVEDAGKTVFPEPTVTCVGIGPVTEDESKLFKRLRLY